MALRKTSHKNFSAFGAAAVAVLLVSAGAVSAQGLYRSVGPDGRVTYSDRAPAATGGKAASVERRPTSVSSVPSATLPFELREVASRFPLTLYSAPDCAPCASARALLAARGVPFTERTITSNDDIARAESALSDDSDRCRSRPLGTQQLKGFSDARVATVSGCGRLSENLSAAGRLASGNRAATPLVQKSRAGQHGCSTSGSADIHAHRKFGRCRAAPGSDRPPRAAKMPATATTIQSGIRF